MFKIIKESFNLYKKHIYEYTTISLAVAFFIYLIFMLGYSTLTMSGVLFGFTFLIVPLLISLKFTVHGGVIHNLVNFKNMKIGFATYFRSVKLYFLTIIKPLLKSIIVYFLCTFLTSIVVVYILTAANPELLNNFYQPGFANSIQELINENSSATKIQDIGAIIGMIVTVISFFIFKSNLDFIPFMAFEFPLDAKKAAEFNKKMLKKHRAKYVFSLFGIVSFAIIPLFICLLLYRFVFLGGPMEMNIIVFILLGVFMLLSAPIVTLIQITHVNIYMKRLIPFEDEIDIEVNKALEEIMKVIDEINKKEK